jgi:Carboxypeptidase regulatory-like domain/Putative zinc-finger
MSGPLQAGQHPDADQLSAFVEHTLPVHEQQQTLAHLADCPACRQIVALSLPPADETPSWQPEAVRRRWSPRWYPAWVATPAIAALILVVLFVRYQETTRRHTSVLSQMADARKPASPPPPAVSAEPETGRNPAPLAQNAIRNSAIKAQKQLPPANRLTREPAGASGSAGGVMGGILGGIGAPPTQPPAPAFAASSASAGGPATTVAVDRLQSAFSTPGPLPSHLAILSMASRGNQRIAIDSDHHVFFSEDEGRNWKAFAAPWKGRPVSVALASAVSFGSMRAALKISSHPAATIGSTLSGTIKDPAGAVIPGATLTASNSSGVLVGSASTDSQGKYRMEALAPGSYRVVVQATGFEKQSFATEVAPSQQAVADATLRVGSAAQTVNIEASPAAPHTSSAGANQALKSAVSQPTSRFELTTDDGEHWTSTDGQSWTLR